MRSRWRNSCRRCWREGSIRSGERRLCLVSADGCGMYCTFRFYANRNGKHCIFGFPANRIGKYCIFGFLPIGLVGTIFSASLPIRMANTVFPGCTPIEMACTALSGTSVSMRWEDSRMSSCPFMWHTTLVTIFSNTNGILPPGGGTVCCGQRAQHS